MKTSGRQNRLGGIGDAFSDRNFRIYSMGSIGSWISFFVQLIAVSWLTWELTESTRWLAVMALLDIVPNVVLMPIAGAIADRFDRHKIMYLTSSLLFAQALLVAVLSYAEELSIWVLAVLVLAHGIFISLMVPAMYGILPRFVARKVLPSAIAVSSSYTQLAVFVGPALAGWIIVNYGVTVAFFVNAIGYLVLICAFLCMKTPDDYERPTPSGRSLLGDIVDGMTYIFSHKTILALMVILLVADSIALGFLHMLPAFSDTVLGLGVVGMTTILAMRGLGATCAALRLAYVGGAGASVGLVLWAFLAALLALGVLVQTTNIYLAAVFAVVMGFAGETRKTATMTIVQLEVDENLRGRVMGSVFMFSQLASGIGAYLIGTLAADAGVQLPTTVAVLIGLCIWVAIFVRWRSAR